MVDDRNLSMALPKFNHPKIEFNNSADVTIPAASASPDTLLTISTQATATPMPPRIYVEYNNILSPAFGDAYATNNTLGIDVLFLSSFNSSNALVIRSFSNEASPISVKIYYRIYLDRKGS